MQHQQQELWKHVSMLRTQTQNGRNVESVMFIVDRANAATNINPKILATLLMVALFVSDLFKYPFSTNLWCDHVLVTLALQTVNSVLPFLLLFGDTSSLYVRPAVLFLFLFPIVKKMELFATHILTLSKHQSVFKKFAHVFFRWVVVETENDNAKEDVQTIVEIAHEFSTLVFLLLDSD